MTATDFLAGGGVTGARLRAHDWSASPVGPPEAWPQSLRTAVGLVLHSSFPACLAWGPERASFYNDACLPILGTRPNALGRPIREVWPERWGDPSPLVARAFSGTASCLEDLPLPLERNGHPEKTWWTFFCSPIGTEAGGVGGLLCVGHETTARVLIQQRLRLRESEARLRQYAEHSTNLLWIFDAETNRFEYLSRACEQVWGESREVLMEDWSRWAERLHRDDRQHVLEVVKRVVAGATTTCEYRIVRTDGSVRWIRDTLFPIRDEHGQVRQAAGLAQNITPCEEGMVYVVDGDGAAPRALARVLQGAGHQVKVFASVRAFLDAAPVLVPGCAVLEVGAVDAAGLAVARELKARRIGLPVVATGARRGDVGLAVQAMKAGVIDYLEAPCTTEALLAAVASALAGVQDAMGYDRASQDARTRVATLSAREREVLEGLLAGGTNKTIGKELGISPRTVEIHRAHVMDRLGAQTLPELVLKGAAGLDPSRSRREGHRRGDARQAR